MSEMATEEQLRDALRQAEARTEAARAALKKAEYELAAAKRAEQEADRALLQHQLKSEVTP